MDAEELASLSKKLSLATQTMREETKQKQKELAGKKVKVARECQEMRTAAQDECDILRIEGEKEITAMLTAAHEAVTAKAETYEQEQADWENEKKRIFLVHRFQDEQVTFSVGGTNFTMYASTLRNSENSKTVLAKKLEAGKKGDPIFIDQDAHWFRYILQYIRSPEQFRLPRDEKDVAELLKEALAYNMPPAFFGTVDDQSVVPFKGFDGESLHVPNPPTCWKQNMALKMFDDDEGPMILHFDGKNEGVVQFNVGEPFVKLQIRNGKGMRFDVEALEDGVWERVTEFRLTKTGWNDPIEWQPRKDPALAWRLLLKKNTEKRWLQNFRWWKLKETTTWEPHPWAKKHLSADNINKIRKAVVS